MLLIKAVFFHWFLSFCFLQRFSFLREGLTHCSCHLFFSMATNEESADSESPSPLPTSPSQPLKHRRNNSMTKCLSAGPMAAASRLMSSLTKQSRTPPLTTTETNNTHEQTSVSMKPFEKRSSAASRRRSSSPESSASTTTLINSSTTTSSDLNQATIEFNLPTPETIDSNFNFESNCTELRDLAESNCRYFSQQKTDVCRRFSRLLMQLIHSLELSIPLIRYLTDHFHKFDYSPEVNRENLLLHLQFFVSD